MAAATEGASRAVVALKGAGRGVEAPAVGNSATATPSTGSAAQSRVQTNRTVGNAFRDQLANLLKAEGREVAKEVYKPTPFGKRFIDIEVRKNGTPLGGIETKTGKSPYTPLQRLKDLYLEKVKGYPVNLVRKPGNWK